MFRHSQAIIQYKQKDIVEPADNAFTPDDRHNSLIYKAEDLNGEDYFHLIFEYVII